MRSGVARTLVIVLCLAIGSIVLVAVLVTTTTQRRPEGEGVAEGRQTRYEKPNSEEQDKRTSAKGEESGKKFAAGDEKEPVEKPSTRKKKQKTLKNDQEKEANRLASSMSRDQSGKYPYLAPDEIPENVRLATSAETPPNKRFSAVWGLAISGYTEESAEALVAVACDKNADETTRGYAAMGLRNFTTQLPEAAKDLIAKRLCTVMEEEKGDTPDGIIRTLIGWGYASFVSEILGEQLQGHTMEIEILAKLPDEESSEKLWQLYQSCPKGHKSVYYGRKAGIGRALADKGDTRGIDILMELLPKESAPGAQYRHNIFIFLSHKIGESFGYNALNYDSALEEAITKMLLWWEDNRGVFILRSSGSKQ